MGGGDIPSADLLAELETLRARVKELERSEFQRKQAEDALRESEARLNRLAESFPIVLSSAEAGTNRRLLLLGQIKELLGYAPQEFIAEPELGARIIHPDDQVRIREAFKDGLASMKPFEFEFRIVHGVHGRPVWLHQHVVPIPREDGTLLRHDSALLDITAHKQAEKELKDSEARFRMLTENSLLGVCIAQDNRLLYVNPVFAQTAGYTREELYRMDLFDLLVPEDRARAGERIQRRMKGEELGDAPFSLRGLHKDGTVIHYESLARNIEYQGRPAIFGTVLNITEQKRAKDALRESEERFQQVVANAQEWIWEVNADGLYTYSSPVVEEILGYTPQEIVGKKHFYDLFHPEDREELRKTAFATFEQRQPFQGFVNRNVQKNGKIVWLSTSAIPMLDQEGNLLGYRGTDNDITERKLAEEALRESEEKWRLLIENVPDYIMMVDRDGTILFINRTAPGLEAEKVIGKATLYQYIAPDQHDTVRGSLEKVFQTGQMAQFDVYSPLLDRWFSDQVVALKRDGKAAAALVIARDITDSKRAEVALQNSEARYRAIIEEQTELVCRYLPDMTLTFVNEAYCRYFGKKREELTGRSFMPLIPEEDHEKVERNHASLSRGRPIVTHEHRVVAADGGICWQQWTNRAVFDEHGRVVEFQSVGCDVTERKRVEDLLQESERRFRGFMDNAPSIAWIKDEDGRHVYLSGTYEQRFGVRLDDWRGKTDFDIWPHETAEEFRKNDLAVLSGDQVVEVVEKTPNADGDYTWWWNFKFPLRDASGRRFVCGIGIDITKRKLAEEALRRERDFSQSLIEASPAFIVGISPDGKTLTMNEAMFQALGYSREEVMGKDYLSTFVPEGERNALSDVFRKLVVLKVPTVNENHVLTKDGRKLLVEWHGRQVFNESGEVDYFFGIGIDITERKRAEEALRESEELYRSLVETSPDGILFVDRDGKIMMLNQRAARLHGFERTADLLGKNCFEFVAPQDRQRALDSYRRDLEEGTFREMQSTLLRRDGSSFLGEASASAVSGAEGRPKGVLVVFRDVTERNRLQQQLLQSQKLESIGTLAGGIAHDFNNLLAVIMGNVSILQRQRSLPEKIRDSLDDIAQAAEKGSALTHQLLDYARGGLRRPAPTDLNRLVESAWQMLHRTTPAGINLVLNVSDSLPAIIADATQIEQVVMNLCLNAIQASGPRGTVEIATAEKTLAPDEAAALELSPGGYVYLGVRDQGCGMDAETLKRAFEPFFTTKPTGRGMGLPAALGIVQSHHGQIRADSTAGGGTTMSVWLPATQMEAPPPPTQDTKKRMAPPRGCETVLVIDDDPAITRTVEQILSPLGYCVVSHTDAAEALAFLDHNSEDVNLVLLNLNIPGHSEKEMLAGVAKRCPGVPILLSSGVTADEPAGPYSRDQVAGFVEKPFTLMTLATAVRKALDERTSRKEKG